MLLCDFDVLFLDLNGTFMFGQDRFGADQPYFDTYRSLGGDALEDGEVREAVDSVVRYMGRLYENPAYAEAFPAVATVLQSLPETRSLPTWQQHLLEQVIAAHEIGRVPPEDAEALHQLAQKIRLVLVSNIWSAKGPWVQHLKDVGVHHLFEHILFSSDFGCIKPGKSMYRMALEAAGAAADRSVFIGDDPILDIGVPRQMGMTTVRILGTTKPVRQEADVVVPRLSGLLTL